MDERAPLVGGRERQHPGLARPANDGDGSARAGRRTDVESGKAERGRARGVSGRTVTYAGAFVVLSACACALLGGGRFPVDALPRAARGFLFRRLRAKDEAMTAQLSAPAVFDDFCRAIGRDGACKDVVAARAGLGAVGEETFEALVDRARAMKRDESDDSVGFLGAYDGMMSGMLDQPRTFVKLVPEWATAGLGFEGGADSSDGAEAKKLSLFVADVFPLLRKYPDWDMSDTNAIRFLTRHINEENFSVDDVELSDFMRASSSTAALSKSEKSTIRGVLPPKDVNRRVPLSPHASSDETHGVHHFLTRLPALGKVELRAKDNRLPTSFDARVAYPKCSRLLGAVRDQGRCGSCWAVAATEVMNDRLCVATDGENADELSPQYALSCFDSGSGCDGGDVLDTLRIAFTKGIPYGGMLDSNTCLPYEFEACDHPCMVAGTTPQSCPAKCADGSALSFVHPTSEPYTCPKGDVTCIAREIMENGSVAVTFGPVYADFYRHTGSGVYKVPNDAGEPLGQHATKLIGWGVSEEGEHYWWMVNSWRNWGENGVSKVRMGEMNIESGIAAIAMK